MAREGTVAEVAVLPLCDFCKQVDGNSQVEAAFDGKTKSGPWANMCTTHYGLYGIGLGVGRGQRLVLAVKEQAAERDAVFCELHQEKHVLNATLPCFDALIVKVAEDADPYAHL